MIKEKKKLILIVVLFILVCILTFMVVNDAIYNLDIYVYNLISKLINDTNTNIFKIITFFGSSSFITLFVMYLCFYFWWKGSRRGGEIAILMILSTIINNVLKIFIQRPRPNILPLVIEQGFSYPSGHTMAVVTLEGLFLYYLWKGSLNVRYKLIISFFSASFILTIMMSRIYLGVHYFSDVLGGFMISSLLVLTFTTHLESKNNVKRSKVPYLKIKNQ